MTRARPSPTAISLAAALLMSAAPTAMPMLAWWRPTGPFATPLRLHCAGERIDIELAAEVDGAYRVSIADETIALKIVPDDGPRLRFLVGDLEREAAYVVAEPGTLVHIALDRDDFAFEDVTLAAAVQAQQAAGGDVRAPMNGAIVDVHVQVGDRVAKGQALVILEAMKMRHEIIAPAAGRVLSVAVKKGDQAQARRTLVELALDEGDGR